MTEESSVAQEEETLGTERGIGDLFVVSVLWLHHFYPTKDSGSVSSTSTAWAGLETLLKAAHVTWRVREPPVERVLLSA